MSVRKACDQEIADFIRIHGPISRRELRDIMGERTIALKPLSDRLQSMREYGVLETDGRDWWTT